MTPIYAYVDIRGLLSAAISTAKPGKPHTCPNLDNDENGQILTKAWLNTMLCKPNANYRITQI